MRKVHIISALTVSLTIFGAILLLILIPPHQKELTAFAVAHPLFAPIILISWRIIAIVIPPIPGAVLSFAFIPIIGWFWSYIFSAIGNLIGATIAFYIARRYREKAVEKFIPIKQLHKWETRLSHKTEFLAFLGIRLTTGPVFDFISYIAGLSKISFKKFFLATLLVEIPEMIWFYIGQKAYDRYAQQSAVVAIIIIAIIGIGILFYIRQQKSLDE